MNLFPKALLLSCLITSGLHCSHTEEDILTDGINALQEILKDCYARNPTYFSKPLLNLKKSKVEDLVICEHVRVCLEELIKRKKEKNYSK